MSSFVSRWVVLQEHQVAPGDMDAAGALRDDVLSSWITAVRDEYLDQCRELRERQRAGLLIRTRASALPPAAVTGHPTNVTVTASATEIYPTSFTMAFRVRWDGSSADAVVNATCDVSLEDPHTGQGPELGEAIRDELIALEHAARHTN